MQKNNKITNIILIIIIIVLLMVLGFLLLKNKRVDNHIIAIDYPKYSELINNDQYSIILLTTSTCMHCNNYKPSVNYVSDEYDLMVYDLDINNITYEEYLEIHDMYTATKDKFLKTGQASILTPTTIIAKNGEEVDSVSGNLGYVGFKDFLKKNDIIKK